MEKNGKRRGMLRAAPVSAALIFVLSFTMWVSALDNRDGMITIIMAKDTTSFVRGVANQEVVQQMVDASIVEVTQVIDDIAFAYECLFPYGGITEETKILIKYNPKVPEAIRKPMVDALKTGLGYMLRYSFPKENILAIGDEGTTVWGTDTILVDSTVIVYDTTIFTFDSLGNPDTIIVSNATTIYAWDASGNPDTIEVPTPTTPSDTIPGLDLKYTIKDVYSEADYIIYCPSAWGTDIGCGVDMCLSLMLSSIEGVDTTTVEDMYPLFHDPTSPSLSLLNYHPTFNGDDEKVVLYMMDLLTYSVTGDTADIQPGHKIYTTQNITVCDWKGIRFLRDTVYAWDSTNARLDSLHEYQAQKVCSLSVDPIDLGVVNEGQMLEVAIGPPWTVGIDKNNKLSKNYIRIRTKPEYTIFSLTEGYGSKATVTIYDIRGKKIWTRTSSDKSIVWNNTNLQGKKVPSGVYVYQLKAGEIKARGKTTIKR
jgi:hypothetical protein